MSRTTSPSSVVGRRSTPWVAGWCGPMLSVNSSSWSSSSAPIRSIVTERSRSRYGTPVGSMSVIPARVLVLVEGEQDGLAAHREVAPLRVAGVVLRHQDAAHVRVAVEDDAEHVVDLALLVVGGGEEVDHRRQARLVAAQARPHVEAVAALHRDQLVVDAEAGLGRQIVDAVQAAHPRP